MSSTIVARLRAGLFLLLLAAATAGASAQARPPVEAFFQHPTFARAVLSPTGRQLAVLVTPNKGRAALMVVDTATLASRVVARYDDVDISGVHWVNEKRVVFTVTDRSGDRLDHNIQAPGLMAIDVDGGNERYLVSTSWMARGQARTMSPSTRFHAAIHSRETDDIWVSQPAPNRHDEFDALNLVRLDTRTGAAEKIDRPGRSVSWKLDAQDAPRVTVTIEPEKKRASLWHMAPGSKQWELLQEFENAAGEWSMDPVGFAPDGTLFVGLRGKDGAGTMAIHRYDLSKRAVDPQPLVAAEGFDIDASLVTSAGRLLGIRYVTDAEATAWFDDEHKKLQEKIDREFPRTINRISVPARPEVPVVLVTSFSDREPGIYSLYDKSSGKFTTVGRRMADIEEAQMAARDFVRLKARDGMDIPAWLTLPRGAKGKKVPMVVLVHGGPWVRGGTWEWHADSQFLASRGYAVLEPEFRGSTGYGSRHYKAGWKQWGLAMQDDVADAAKWAIEKGIADASRICIAGASYGGYATLMGLINDPDLFRCGINWVGVTDIDLMYSVAWSDFSMEHRSIGMPLLVGDREKDAAQLKATSPLLNAHKVRQPLLMAYGGIDPRVPIVHGTRFRDAVKKTNDSVEWVEYPDEGHGWYLVKNRVDFWTRVEKFLARHLGN